MHKVTGILRNSLCFTCVFINTSVLYGGVGLHTIKHSPVLIGLINLISICLIQWYAASLLKNEMTLTHFHLFYIPILLVGVNVLLWLGGWKVRFHLYWLFMYIGHACSILIFYFIFYIDLDLAAWEGFPPGEAYWDLFLFVFTYALLQLIVLGCLNIITYLFYRLFIFKNETIG